MPEENVTFHLGKKKTSFRCTTENKLFVLKVNKTATFQNDRLEFIKTKFTFFFQKITRSFSSLFLSDSPILFT